MMDITWLSDFHREYTDELDQCTTLAALKAFLDRWRSFAPDAYAVRERIGELTFIQFRKGLLSERAERYAGDEWAEKYGNIVMPDLFIHVSMAALNFHVPWGAAFLRMKEEGLIVERDGAYFFQEPTP